MPQFCMQFYAKYTILATQRGDHGPMPPPLNTPLAQPDKKKFQIKPQKPFSANRGLKFYRISF